MLRKYAIMMASLLGLIASPLSAEAEIVSCSFGVAKVIKADEGEKKELALSQVSPDFIDNTPTVVLDLDEGTYSEIGHADSWWDYAYHLQLLKFKDMIILMSDLPDIGKSSFLFQRIIYYYPDSKTAVELYRRFEYEELKAELAGKSPHLLRKEAIARIDPNLIINIAPCRDATKEEIEKTIKLGPPNDNG